MFQLESFYIFYDVTNRGGPARLQSVIRLQTVCSWELRIKNMETFIAKKRDLKIEKH